MEWHKILKLRLRDRRVTYQALADELGVTEAAVGHWLTGRREPPLEAVKLLAERAGMTLDELFQDESKYLIADADEVEIVRALRKIPSQDKATLLRMLSGMAQPAAVIPAKKAPR